MEREKLFDEYKVTLESLVAKTKFIYSDEFYKLDEFDKKKYQNDKMATEVHLGTLCNLLWGEKSYFNNNGLFDLFGLGIIGSMFSGGCFGSNSPSSDSLKETHGGDENKENVFSIPVKSTPEK